MSACVLTPLHSAMCFFFFLQEWGPKVILFYAQNNSRNESV